MQKQKIVPCLWFDFNAEEAVKYYTSIFPRSRIAETSRYGEGGPVPKGTVLTMMFELDGQELMALNGGPQYKFTEAVSLSVKCDTQKEIDTYTEKLLAGGGEQQPCGWVKDRFGFSWQIVPAALGDLLGSKDRAKAERVMKALLQMKKLDIAALEAA